MKKHALLFLLFLILFPFCSCSETKQIKEPTYNTSMEYSGFSNIPDNYTPKKAKEDGCFVIESEDESDTKSKVHGKNQWQSFFKNSNKGEDSFLRVAHFIGDEGYYTDLFYCENKYYQYTKDEYGIRLKGPYKYLRALAGEDGMPRKQVTLYVLTDSMELTCDDVLRSFYSSNLETITKIPFVWLGFTTYLEKVDDISSISKE